MLLRTFARSTSLLPEMVGTVLLERGGEKRGPVVHPCHPTDPKSPTPSHKVTVAQSDTRCVGLSGPLHWTFFHWRRVSEPQNSGSTSSTFEGAAHPVLRAGRRHQAEGTCPQGGLPPSWSPRPHTQAPPLSTTLDLLNIYRVPGADHPLLFWVTGRDSPVKTSWSSSS